MKNVFYVQRLNKPFETINPFSFGGGLCNGGISDDGMQLLKNIFSFDYMGSTEFEWGAVPKAIESLFTNKDIVAFVIEDIKPIYVICPTVIRDDVTEWVKLAAKGLHGNLKEYLGLDTALRSDGDLQGWLKIEGDNRCTEPFMFFIDRTMFDNVCKLFDIVAI